MCYITDVFLGTWPKFTEQLFSRMYVKQKPLEYSPSGVLDPLMLVVAKGHAYQNKPATLS